MKGIAPPRDYLDVPPAVACDAPDAPAAPAAPAAPDAPAAPAAPPAPPMTRSHATDESTEARFVRLLREHGAALARLAAAYERDPHDREDLVQDIAFAIW